MFHLVKSELTNFLTAYGYWVVLLFVAIESTGIHFPGETMLLVASIYAGTTHRLAIPLVIVAAAAGAILGDKNEYGDRTNGYTRTSTFSTPFCPACWKAASPSSSE